MSDNTKKIILSVCVSVFIILFVPLVFSSNSDSRGTSANAETVCNGDLNGDNVVNILDLSLAGSCFGLDPSVETRCQPADVDNDGDVELDDVLFVVSFYGQVCTD